MADADLTFVTLDFEHGERVQTLRCELGDGHARESWDQGGAGRPSRELPPPENLAHS